MSRFDFDREELIRLIISICDYARLGYDISTHNNCNSCKDKECKYRPDWGDPVRWNCPLWKDEEVMACKDEYTDDYIVDAFSKIK